MDHPTSPGVHMPHAPVRHPPKPAVPLPEGPREELA